MVLGYLKFGFIVIFVVLSWLIWSCCSVVYVNVIINVINKCIKIWNFVFWKKKCFCMLICIVILWNVFIYIELYMFVN